MRISKSYSVQDWKALSFSDETDWQRAIGIFVDRIETRFLGFIRLIERREHSGFVVMALDCLLIETLEQFYKGVPETPFKKSKDYFMNFLTTSSFGKFFSQASAEVFYRQIRCGILHQAEIKGDSRILITRGKPLVTPSKHGGLIINRKLFHGQLVKEYEDYVSRLRRNDPPDQDLRSKFREKMNYICNPVKLTES
jgi:hypothetical protein